jgi:two-component system, sensor histidine kinase RegB
VLPVVTTRQVLSALVKNGLDANTGEKPVEIAGTVVNGKIRFTVRDFGTGMSAETLKRVGEPFFTTKAAGRGMGLGTFLVRVFAENVRGSLTFDSEPDQGTTAILEWPVVRRDAE